MCLDVKVKRLPEVCQVVFSFKTCRKEDESEGKDGTEEMINEKNKLEEKKKTEQKRREEGKKEKNLFYNNYYHKLLFNEKKTLLTVLYQHPISFIVIYLKFAVWPLDGASDF